MTEDQIALVRESFAKVAPTAPAAAELFYGRPFALYPALRPCSRVSVTALPRPCAKAPWLAVSSPHVQLTR